MNATTKILIQYQITKRYHNMYKLLRKQGP